MKGSHVCKMDTTKKVVLIVLPLLVAVLSISIWFSATAVDRTDGSVLFTFILNWMLGLCALEWEIYRRPISFAQIHWLFFLVFFGYCTMEPVPFRLSLLGLPRNFRFTALRKLAFIRMGHRFSCGFRFSSIYTLSDVAKSSSASLQGKVSANY